MTPGEVDAAVVRRHLAALESAVAGLGRYRGLGAGELAADERIRWAVERGIQLAAQNALDVAVHIVAAAGGEVLDYASAVDGLARLGVLPREFAARFRAVAGLRNVLVHGDLDVDLEVLAGVLSDHLDEFLEFARPVERWLPP